MKTGGTNRKGQAGRCVCVNIWKERKGKEKKRKERKGKERRREWGKGKGRGR